MKTFKIRTMPLPSLFSSSSLMLARGEGEAAPTSARRREDGERASGEDEEALASGERTRRLSARMVAGRLWRGMGSRRDRRLRAWSWRGADLVEELIDDGGRRCHGRLTFSPSFHRSPAPPRLLPVLSSLAAGLSVETKMTRRPPHRRAVECTSRSPPSSPRSSPPVLPRPFPIRCRALLLRRWFVCRDEDDKKMKMETTKNVTGRTEIVKLWHGCNLKKLQ